MVCGAGAGSGENQATESTRGYAVTRGAPPMRGTRSTSPCGPANAAPDAACVLDGAGCSPLLQAARQSATIKCRFLAALGMTSCVTPSEARGLHIALRSLAT